MNKINVVFCLFSRLIKEGEYFLCYKEIKKNQFRDRLRFFGGKFEKGEDYIAVIVREMIEELEADIDNIELLVESSNIFGGISYLCCAKITNLRNLYPKKDEIGDVYWSTAEKLFKSNLTPNSKLLLYAYLLKNNVKKLNNVIQIIANYQDDGEFETFMKENDEEIYSDFRDRLRI